MKAGLRGKLRTGDVILAKKDTPEMIRRRRHFDTNEPSAANKKGSFKYSSHAMGKTLRRGKKFVIKVSTLENCPRSSRGGTLGKSILGGVSWNSEGQGAVEALGGSSCNSS